MKTHYSIGIGNVPPGWRRPWRGRGFRAFMCAACSRLAACLLSRREIDIVDQRGLFS